MLRLCLEVLIKSSQTYFQKPVQKTTKCLSCVSFQSFIELLKSETKKVNYGFIWVYKKHHVILREKNHYKESSQVLCQV